MGTSTRRPFRHNASHECRAAETMAKVDTVQHTVFGRDLDLCQIFEIKSDSRLSIGFSQLQKLLLTPPSNISTALKLNCNNSCHTIKPKSNRVKIRSSKFRTRLRDNGCQTTQSQKTCISDRMEIQKDELRRDDSVRNKTFDRHDQPPSIGFSKEKCYGISAWDSSSSCSSGNNTPRSTLSSVSKDDSLVSSFHSSTTPSCLLQNRRQTFQPMSSSTQTLSQSLPERIRSWCSDIHETCPDYYISVSNSSMIPNFIPECSVSSIDTRWKLPQDIDSSWIPFHGHDLINNYISNTCCAHSKSCPHRRLASTVNTNEILIHADDVFMIDSVGETLLHTAARWGASLDIISYLMGRINVNVTNFRGETFMHLLKPSQTSHFWDGFPDLLAEVIYGGLQIDALDCQGRTFITRLIDDLVTSADAPLVQYYIIDKILSEEQYLMQKLLLCEEAGGTVSTNLIKNLAKIEVALKNDGHWAQAGGARFHIHQLQFTSVQPTPLNATFYSNPNSFNTDGKTAVMELISNQQSHPQQTNITRLEKLLERDVNLNLQDSQGNTALHQAIILGLPSFVRVLLKHGADPRLRNLNGMSGFELAQEHLCQGNRLSRTFAHRLAVVVALKRSM